MTRSDMQQSALNILLVILTIILTALNILNIFFENYHTFLVNNYLILYLVILLASIFIIPFYFRIYLLKIDDINHIIPKLTNIKLYFYLSIILALLIPPIIYDIYTELNNKTEKYSNIEKKVNEIIDKTVIDHVFQEDEIGIYICPFINDGNDETHQYFEYFLKSRIENEINNNTIKTFQNDTIKTFCSNNKILDPKELIDIAKKSKARMVITSKINSDRNKIYFVVTPPGIYPVRYDDKDLFIDYIVKQIARMIESNIDHRITINDSKLNDNITKISTHEKIISNNFNELSKVSSNVSIINREINNHLTPLISKAGSLILTHQYIIDKLQTHEDASIPVKTSSSIKAVLIKPNYVDFDKLYTDGKNMLSNANDKIDKIKTNLLSLQFSKIDITTSIDKEATKKNIMKTIDQVFQNSNKNDLILIYFLGYAVVKDNNENFISFLIPSDAKLITAPDKISLQIKNCICKNEVIKCLNNRNRNVLVFIDAFYIGVYNGDIIYIPANKKDYAPLPEKCNIDIINPFNLLLSNGGNNNFIIISSGSDDQIWCDKKRNISEGFSDYIIEALAGKADLDGDNRVAVEELFYNLYSRVTFESNQMMCLPKISGYGSKDFIVSTIKPIRSSN